MMFLKFARFYAVSPTGIDFMILDVYDVTMKMMGTKIDRIMLLLAGDAYQPRTKLPPMFLNLTFQGMLPFVMMGCERANDICMPRRNV